MKRGFQEGKKLRFMYFIKEQRSRQEIFLKDVLKICSQLCIQGKSKRGIQKFQKQDII